MGFEWDCAGWEYLIGKDNSDDGCSGAAVRECAVVPAATLAKASAGLVDCKTGDQDNRGRFQSLNPADRGAALGREARVRASEFVTSGMKSPVGFAQERAVLARKYRK